jgi:hypothetical protein
MEIMRCWLSVVSDWLEAHSGAVTAVATVFIAWFTIALAYSTKRLWREAKLSSRIANKAAIAAKKSADVSEQIMLKAQRAFVAMKNFETTMFYTDEGVKGCYLSAKWTNTGITTAVHCNAGITFEVVDGEPKSIVFTKDPITSLDNLTIGPNTNIGSTNTIMADELVKIYKGGCSLFVLARIEYEDVFRVKHHTQVCSKAKLFADPMVLPVVPHLFHWGAWNEHNSSD